MCACVWVQTNKERKDRRRKKKKKREEKKDAGENLKFKMNGPLGESQSDSSLILTFHHPQRITSELETVRRTDRQTDRQIDRDRNRDRERHRETENYSERR